MVVTINGKRHWLWRAVDNEGEMLDFLVQTKRNAKVAAPSRIVTDRLRSYSAAFRAMALTAQHDRGLRASNRAENSHLPIRRRERKQQGFKSPSSAQRFLSVHAATFNTFYHQRHLTNRANFKQLRAGSFEAWSLASTAAWSTRPL